MAGRPVSIVVMMMVIELVVDLSVLSLRDFSNGGSMRLYQLSCMIKHITRFDLVSLEANLVVWCLL